MTINKYKIVVTKENGINVEEREIVCLEFPTEKDLDNVIKEQLGHIAYIYTGIPDVDI